jgi:sugar/nucleoside kinase (ribokinase family)
MVMVIWAVVAEVIITDGAEGAVIITAGTAVDIAITTEIRNRRP